MTIDFMAIHADRHSGADDSLGRRVLAVAAATEDGVADTQRPRAPRGGGGRVEANRIWCDVPRPICQTLVTTPSNRSETLTHTQGHTELQPALCKYDIQHYGCAQ